MRQKGQMVFQFLIGAVLLFIIVVYTLGLLTGAAATARSDADANLLESKAMQIANKLVKTNGTWVGGIPLELGIAGDWPVADTIHFLNLIGYCQSPDEAQLLGLLDLDRQGVSIAINAIILETGERISVIACSPSGVTQPPAETSVAQATRFVVFSGTLYEITITLWNL